MTNEEVIAAFEPVRFVDIGMLVWFETAVGWVNAKVTMAAGYTARVENPRRGLSLLCHVDDLRKLPPEIQKSLRQHRSAAA